MTKRTACLALALALAVAGCSDADPGGAASDDASLTDDVPRGTDGSGDFFSEATPVDVAKKAEYVVEGVVDDFADGHTEVVTDEQGRRETDRFVVIRIKVTSVLKGAPSSFSSGFAYATRSRGVQTYDAAGALVPGRDLAIPPEAFERDLPRGATIVVMAAPASAHGGVVQDARAGVPERSAPILDVENPQSILIDSGVESGLHGWQGVPGLTFSSARADVRALLAGSTDE